jgi:glycosyltransferase involved in cell wall biosynthesis
LIKITVIVPTKNNADILTSCLEKLKLFNEVIVIDSNSSDNTKSIVLSYNYKYFNFEWNGKFPKKRNWALRNLNLKNNWVLFLDSDEILTDNFILELYNNVDFDNYNGFWITYDNYFLNKKIEYGLRTKKLALFNKIFGEFEYIDEENWSKYDMEIHEHPIISGKIGYLKSSISHFDFKSIHNYIEKHNEYSTWEANRFFKKKNTGNLTFRQKVKYKLINKSFFFIIYFIFNYIIKFGFLDGRNGFILSVLKSFYFFQIYTKINEQQIK